ncbi:MAG: cob(I)yrinic acid a,c-diamide adenosyltransferase [Tannerellaceae bacterium]|jgi:cob(I)alamin adenosyltransferase|nr:cob(I)yrinic acid a,c-diamide adenosyltransferase [Tannerellaceae bacterium]
MKGKEKGSKVYTKGGDKGWTSLVGGVRIPKSDLRIESYGTVDELNSFIGLLRVTVNEKRDKDFLLLVQHKLFSIGAYLATDTKKTDPVAPSKLTEADIQCVEEEIDHLDGGLPPMRAFVLPGGNYNAAIAHVCRTICRRAERGICLLAQKASVDDLLLTFINRLSDYFFVLARKESLNNGENEIVWEAGFA